MDLINDTSQTKWEMGKTAPNATDRQKVISENAIGALKKIGRENKLNELRVAKYGIEVK